MSRHLFIASLLAVVVLSVACSDEEEKAQPITGVNDVTKACAIRAQWKNTSALDCNQCLGISTTPLCDCTSTREYAGKCADQQTAKNNEPDCSGVGECAFRCTSGDCNCVDACYAGKEACRPRANALEGCLAEVCDKYCR